MAKLATIYGEASFEKFLFDLLGLGFEPEILKLIFICFLSLYRWATAAALKLAHGLQRDSKGNYVISQLFLFWAPPFELKFKGLQNLIIAHYWHKKTF